MGEIRKFLIFLYDMLTINNRMLYIDIHNEQAKPLRKVKMKMLNKGSILGAL